MVEAGSEKLPCSGQEHNEPYFDFLDKDIVGFPTSEPMPQPEPSAEDPNAPPH